MDNEATFTVAVVGRTSRAQYAGEFTVKQVLSKRDEFAADQVRRELIGSSPENTPAPVKLQGDAFMLGQLRIRLKKWPKWWETCDFGMELRGDDNLIEELYVKALNAEKAYLEDIQKSAAEAAASLQK
jgi:hypothetical protein